MFFLYNHVLFKCTVLLIPFLRPQFLSSGFGCCVKRCAAVNETVRRPRTTCDEHVVVEVVSGVGHCLLSFLLGDNLSLNV